MHALACHAAEQLLLSASADATVRLWATATLTPLYALRSRGRLEPIAHDGAIYALLLVPPDTAPDAPPDAAPDAAHDTALDTAHTSWRLLSGGADKLIRAWSLATLEQHAALRGHRSFVCALAAHPARRRLLSASSDKTCACLPPLASL